LAGQDRNILQDNLNMTKPSQNEKFGLF